MTKFKLTAVACDNSRIGIMGGSFNPAHEGHLHITLEAIKRFNLKKVYWLVTPQNPLKDHDQTSTFEFRKESALAVAKDHRIIVSDYEQYQKTTYTFDTITRIKKQHPRAQLLWIMGADIVASFHRWKKWKGLVNNIPVAIFDRQDSFYSNLKSRLISCFPGGKVVMGSFCGDLSTYPWYIVQIKKHPESSTRIRSKYQNGIWYKK